MTTPHPSQVGDRTVNDQPRWDDALRTLLAAPPRPRCVRSRATGRALVARDRRVVPVAALGRAV